MTERIVITREDDGTVRVEADVQADSNTFAEALILVTAGVSRLLQDRQDSRDHA